VESGQPLLRRRISAESRAEFPSIAELAPDAKLIGDGTLAIFNAEDREQACGSALAAAAQARTSLAELNLRRGADGLPTTDMYLALHLGALFCGNIRQQGTSRLHGDRAGGERSEPDRCALPLTRAADSPLADLRGGGRQGERAAGVGRALCFARRQPRPGIIHGRSDLARVPARMMGFASLDPSYESDRRAFRSRSQSTATATMPGKMK
jgi:hypothetical protein